MNKYPSSHNWNKDYNFILINIINFYSYIFILSLIELVFFFLLVTKHFDLDSKIWVYYVIILKIINILLKVNSTLYF